MKRINKQLRDEEVLKKIELENEDYRMNDEVDSIYNKNEEEKWHFN